MSLKLHLLHSYLDKFPENLGDVGDEQGFIKGLKRWRNAIKVDGTST